MAFLKVLKKTNTMLAVFCLGVILTASIWFFVSYAHSQDTEHDSGSTKKENIDEHKESAEKTDNSNSNIGFSIGLIAAALATGMSSLGAAWAVSTVGAAAVGSLAEKPESLGGMIIFVGLAEGIAIYGLIISILILGKL